MTGTELQPLEPAVHPTTGEVLSLDQPSVMLAGWLDEIKQVEGMARAAKAQIGDELLKRMDADAAWTMHLPGFKVTGPSPAPSVEYDPDLLHDTLSDLREQGLISEQAQDQALELVVTRKPRAAGINALRKLGGLVAERVDGCARQVEKARRVSVRPVR